MNMLATGLPLVAAPMAGGVSQPALVRGAARAGAFAFVAGGYTTVEGLSAQVGLARQEGSTYGVNLFVPGPHRASRQDFARYRDCLQPEAAHLGVDLLSSCPQPDDDAWQDKIDLLLAEPVPVVSFTFGVPATSVVSALQRKGSLVMVTVTSAAEAVAAAIAGVDAVIAQGSAAGGHSAIHDPRHPVTPKRAVDLTREVKVATGLPVIAAGGVDGPRAVRDLLAAGAFAVAVGTMLLRTEESGASVAHKAALSDPAFTRTVMTPAFTGRPARALLNHFVNAYHPQAPIGYPDIHHLTRPLRQAAAATGDAERLHLWAGTGYRAAQPGGVEEVLQGLAAQL